MKDTITRRSMIAGTAGIGIAAAVGLGGTTPASAVVERSGATESTEEWLLETRGLTEILGRSAPRIRSEVAAALSRA